MAKDVVKNISIKFNDIIQLSCNPKDEFQFSDEVKEPVSFSLRTFDNRNSCITRSQWNKITAAGNTLLDVLEAEQAKRR